MNNETSCKSTSFLRIAIVFCVLAILGSGCYRNQDINQRQDQNQNRNQLDSEKTKKFSLLDPDRISREIKARARKTIDKDIPDLQLDRVRSILQERTEPDPQLKEFDTESLIQAQEWQQKAVYGVDNRQDLYDVVDANIQNDADGVVSVFTADRIAENENGTSTLLTRQFGVAYKLCPNETFYDQPRGASCSGFLVAPDMIATAGHCVETPEYPLAELRFVFGFRMRDAKNAETVISNSEIYQAVKVVGRTYTQTGADWALVRLDRKVTNHRVLAVRKKGKVSDNQAVQVIGHPCGLPVKFADGAVIRTNSDANGFIANLDAFGGNSGSPVFSSNDHVVEGILVRGETDFEKKEQCWVSTVCPTTGCKGEFCTRTTLFSHLIP